LSDPITALYAVPALGEIGHRAALPWLRPLLDSIDTELRSAATQAIGLLGDEASRPRLVALLQDAGEGMDVRVGAAFAICCLPGDTAAATAFLAEREQRGDYHAETLRLLRDKLANR
jgi:HEAT repeat protein